MLYVEKERRTNTMEMKNICGKIPVELHEKLKLEVEELGISIPKYLEW